MVKQVLGESLAVTEEDDDKFDSGFKRTKQLLQSGLRFWKVSSQG